MLTDEELLAIANKARRCLQVGTILSDFPVGRCKITSIFLMRWLETQVQPVNMSGIRGTRLDPAFPEVEQAHFWITVGDVIIDITADQYVDGPAPVIVSRTSEWHSTFDQTAWPAATFFLRDHAPHFSMFGRAMAACAT